MGKWECTQQLPSPTHGGAEPKKSRSQFNSEAHNDACMSQITCENCNLQNLDMLQDLHTKRVMDEQLAARQMTALL